MIIGVCGKTGSGKSTITKILSEMRDDVIVCDLDKIGHYVLTKEEVIKELVSIFGDRIIIDNQIDRKKLGKIVFADESDMKRLTDISWRYIEIEINKTIDKNKDKIIVLDGALLTKMPFFNKCDLKILVDVPYEIRKARVMKRDNITSEYFDLREKACLDYNQNDFNIIIKDVNMELIRKLVVLNG